MKDWPRIAKLQSDLLAQALVTRQTRVASYMLTKGQGLARFPWLGLTAARHHDYTHADGKAPGADGARRTARPARHLPLARRGIRLPAREAQVDSRGRRHGSRPHAASSTLTSTPKRTRTRTAASRMIVAGHVGKSCTGLHSRVTGTLGDLYLTLADDVMNAGLGKFPTATRKITEILA